MTKDTDAGRVVLTPPKIHELKTDPHVWEAVNDGSKNFEVRRDDRGFQKGDILRLKRWHVANWHEQRFNSPTIDRVVTFILTGGQYGVEPGYVVMALADGGTQ